MAKTIFFYYCFFLVLFVVISGLINSAKSGTLVSQAFLLPLLVYFVTTFWQKITKKTSSQNIFGHKILVYYNFILMALMSIIGFIGAQNPPQLISAILFFPLAVYFGQLVLPKRKQALPLILPPVTIKPSLKPLHTSQRLKQLKKIPSRDAAEGTLLSSRIRFDADRRMFIKLIGSAGLTVFFFSIFTRKAQAAFFGSVPGPGTISIKDSSGTVIDPALKQPTDGYQISQVDDSTPAYYGFMNKDGLWYIMQENSGAYLYAKGSTNFSTNWTNRASLSYDYFSSVF